MKLYGGSGIGFFFLNIYKTICKTCEKDNRLYYYKIFFIYV